MSAFWFTQGYRRIAKDHLGIDVHPGKLRDLVDLADNDINLWYYLGALTSDHKEIAEEVVNFILGPLAATLKERGLGWGNRDRVVHFVGLQQMFEALALGLIPKSIRKDLDAAMVTRFNADWIERSRHCEMETVWKSTNGHYACHVVPTTNPAAEAFYAILTELLEATLAGPSNDELSALVEKVMTENPAQVEKAKADPKLIGWFIGQVNKASQTKLDPNTVRAIITEKLGG